MVWQIESRRTGLGLLRREVSYRRDRQGSWTKSKGTAAGCKALDRGVESAVGPENEVKTHVGRPVLWRGPAEGIRWSGGSVARGLFRPCFCSSRCCQLVRPELQMLVAYPCQHWSGAGQACSAEGGRFVPLGGTAEADIKLDSAEGSVFETTLQGVFEHCSLTAQETGSCPVSVVIWVRFEGSGYLPGWKQTCGLVLKIKSSLKGFCRN